jgi:hypothetical protein
VGLASAEGHELGGEVRGALPGPLDHLELGPQGRVVAELGEQPLRAPEHHRHQVVELVGHSARQPPHRLELLRLAKLGLALGQRGLGPPARGDVAGHAEHPGGLPGLVADPGKRGLHPHRRPVLAGLLELEPPIRVGRRLTGLLHRERLGEGLPHHLLRARGETLLGGLGEAFLRRVAAELEDGRAHVERSRLQVEDRDDVGGVLGQDPVEALALPHRAPRGLLRGIGHGRIPR